MLDPAYSILSEDPAALRAAGLSDDMAKAGVMLDGPLGPCVVGFYSEHAVCVMFAQGHEAPKDPTKDGWLVNRVRYNGRLWFQRDGLSFKLGDHVSVHRLHSGPFRENEPTSSARAQVRDVALGAARFADAALPLLSLRGALAAARMEHERARTALAEATATFQETTRTEARAHTAMHEALGRLAAAEVDANRRAAGLPPRTF
jgi:hypothetical protein